MTESHFWTAFPASLVAAAVTTIGIVVIRRFEGWGRRNAGLFVSFAAGILISVSFLHIVPTSIGMNVHAPAYLLAGYLFMHVFNRFLSGHVCNRPETADQAIGLLPMVAIGLHSFIDGVVYSVTFTVSVFTGLLATAGMVLHEFPEGILTYLLLLRGGFSARMSFILAFLAAAVTTPLGMLVSFPVVGTLAPAVLGSLLSLSAGALVYVGATHLLPQAEREPRRYGFVALSGGVLLAVAIVISHR